MGRQRCWVNASGMVQYHFKYILIFLRGRVYTFAEHSESHYYVGKNYWILNLKLYKQVPSVKKLRNKFVATLMSINRLSLEASFQNKKTWFWINLITEEKIL